MTRSLRLLAPLALALALGCTKEQVCTSGDRTLCGSTCVKLDTDRTNCGACGRACGTNETCQASACVCPPGFTVCSGACVHLASDAANCGACGNACTGGKVCTTPLGGSPGCALNCSAGQTACGDSCVDLLSQRANCGACGRACGSGEGCSAGRCVADLYLACFNTDEVREATSTLEAAGTPIDVAPGPIGLAWAGNLLAVASGKTGGAETVALLDFGAPGLHQAKILETSAARPDVEYLAEHDGVLYVSHNSSGTLLLVKTSGEVVDEVTLSGGTTNPNPQGIAFDGAERAYLALQAGGSLTPPEGEVLVLDVSGVSSCAAGTQTPPCTSEVARIDLAPLASPGATSMPARIAVDSGHAYVALWNLDGSWNPPAGSTGRVAAIRTDLPIPALDPVFAGTANGLIDLGPACLNAADVAVSGGKLYVTCGAFDYSSYPAVAINGAGLVPVDVSGSVAQVKAIIPPFPDQARPYAPGKLAFCGTTGYVGDRNTGRVLVFDPLSGATTLGAGVDLCPASGGYAYIADIACGR
jgi:hypothetical protein